MYELLLVTGIANGILYGLLALAFTFLFKTTGVPNLAIGGLGTVIGLVTLELYGPAGLPYWSAIFLALALGGILGLGTERAIFSRLRGSDPLVLLVATIGLNLVLIGLAQLIWAENEPYEFPRAYSRDVSFVLDGLSPQSVAILVATVLVLASLSYFLYRTRSGREIRAVAEDERSAELIGLSVEKSHRVAWGITTAIIGAAAVLFAPLLLLDTRVLNLVMYKALGAAVLGGLGSLPGAVLGGIALGVIENMVVPFAPDARDAATFVVIILVLLWRPQGLLGRREVRKI